MEKERPGVALFGFGRIGRIHFKTLQSIEHEQELLYIVDDFTAPVWEAKIHYRLHSTTVLEQKDTHRVLQDPRVKGVIVCTPTNAHFTLVMAALEAKKHVMCEKPIALSLQETRQCYEAAAANGVQLLCALNHRFDPMFRSLRDKVSHLKVKSGSIGRLQFAQHFVRDHPAPASSVLANLVHGIDTLMWVAGERATEGLEVVAFAHGEEEATKARGDFDAFALMLKFPSGLIAYVDSCRYAPYGYDQKLEVVGSTGALVAETPREGNLVTRDPSGDKLQPLAYSFPQRFADSYRDEVLHFARIIKGEEECEVAGDDVVATMTAVFAAEASARSGKVSRIHY